MLPVRGDSQIIRLAVFCSYPSARVFSVASVFVAVGLHRCEVGRTVAVDADSNRHLRKPHRFEGHHKMLAHVM